MKKALAVVFAVCILGLHCYALATPPASPSTWEYSSHSDKMRGTISKFATLKGVGDDNFKMALIIRNRGKDGFDLFFPVGGTIYEGKSTIVKAKFDSGPILQYYADTGPGYDAAFINNKLDFFQKIQKSNSLIIEVDLYRFGRRQFEFNIKGFDINHMLIVVPD